jgi:hypothetical protein
VRPYPPVRAQAQMIHLLCCAIHHEIYPTGGLYNHAAGVAGRPLPLSA